MNKQSVYSLAGLAWLMCCLYQLKNDNMFMVVFSAVISALCFGCALYKKIRAGRTVTNGSDGKQ